MTTIARGYPFTIRLSVDERTRLERLKRESGLNMSDVVRQLLRRGLSSARERGVMPRVGGGEVRASVTRWGRRHERGGSPEETTWGELFDAFGHPGTFLGRRTHPGWSPCVFSPPLRARPNLRGVTALVVEGDVTVATAAATFDAFAGFVHTATENGDGARVILPLVRVVDAAGHARLVRWARRRAERFGWAVSEGSEDPSRYWQDPGVLPGATFDAVDLPGDPLDPETVRRKRPKLRASE